MNKPEMIQTGQEMVTLLKTHNPDILAGAQVEKQISRTEFANSAGAEFVDESTLFRPAILGDLVRGTDMLHVDKLHVGRKRETDHLAFTREAIEWFRLAKQNVPIQSGDLPVILTPYAMHLLLLSLNMGLDGKNVLLGDSPLAGKLGERVADSRFSLIDDPFIDYADGSGRYDGEGIPRQAMPLIQDGVVRNFLYDLDTAGRAGVPSTGHGPERRPTNLLIT